MVYGDSFPGLKKQRSEADRLFPSSVCVKNESPIHLYGMVLTGLSTGTTCIYFYTVNYICTDNIGLEQPAVVIHKGEEITSRVLERNIPEISGRTQFQDIMATVFSNMQQGNFKLRDEVAQ
jgi:hypothetical protein